MLLTILPHTKLIGLCPQVLLASDSNCDRAACALCVGVGRLHEPKESGVLAEWMAFTPVDV